MPVPPTRKHAAWSGGSREEDRKERRIAVLSSTLPTDEKEGESGVLFVVVEEKEEVNKILEGTAPRCSL